MYGRRAVAHCRGPLLIDADFPPPCPLGWATETYGHTLDNGSSHAPSE